MQRVDNEDMSFDDVGETNPLGTGENKIHMQGSVPEFRWSIWVMGGQENTKATRALFHDSAYRQILRLLSPFSSYYASTNFLH